MRSGRHLADVELNKVRAERDDLKHKVAELQARYEMFDVCVPVHRDCLPEGYPGYPHGEPLVYRDASRGDSSVTGDGRCSVHGVVAGAGCVLCPKGSEASVRTPLMEHPAIGNENRTWWVHNGFPWVLARSDYPAYGNIYLPQGSNRPLRWESSYPGQDRVRVLRPAVFYPEREENPGLIESGERRPAKQGEWIEVDGLPVNVSADTEQFPWPILVELDSEMSAYLDGNSVPRRRRSRV